MNRKRAAVRKRVVLLFFSILLLVPQLGWAKGDGIKIGQNGRFHPQIFINSGYDSNVFHRAADNAQNAPLYSPVGSFFINVRPGLQLDIPSETISFELAGYVNYGYYFSNSAATLRHQFTAKADLALRLFERGPVSFSIVDHFSRNGGDALTANDLLDQRTIFSPDLGTVFGGAFINHTNEAEALLSIQPGGGAFRVDLGYRFRFAINPDEDTDYNTHRIRLNVKWTFFPKTAIFVEANGEFYNYNPRLDFSRASQLNRNAVPVKGAIGIVGHFTERLTLTARVGGGYIILDDAAKQITGANLPADSYGMVLGSLMLSYYFTPTVLVRVGARHDFHPTFFSNYYHETVGSVELIGQFNRFLVSIKGDVGFLGFGQILRQLSRTNPFNGAQETTVFNAQNINPANATTGVGETINREDLFVRARATFDWNIVSWFTVGIQTGLEFRNSNIFVVTSSGQVNLGYFALEASLKLEAAF